MNRKDHPAAYMHVTGTRILSACLLVSLFCLTVQVCTPGILWADGETITIDVEDADFSLPTLVAGEDFTLGQAVGSDPMRYTDEDGNTPLADLAEQKAEEGLQIAWYDADTGESFSWTETIVETSLSVLGTWETKVCEVTVVYNDGETDSTTVEVPYGLSYLDVAEEPESPSKTGWSFTGWYCSDYDDDGTCTLTEFDFGEAVLCDTVVEAHYAVSSAAKAETTAAEEVEETLTGSVYIGATWGSSQSYFALYNFTDGLSGASATGHCTMPTAAAPTYTWATYTAELVSVDYETGAVVYSVHVVPPGVSDGVTRNSLGLIGYQTVDATVTIYKSFGGYIDLLKTSGNKSITEGNSCYSLAGATYTIYDADGDAVDALTTDAEGCTDSSGLLPIGSYIVKETSPAEGYELDETEYAVTVESGKTVRVNGESVTDAPAADQGGIIICKADAETGESSALAAASLEGALFAVEYYDGYYSSAAKAEASGDPERTWVFATDEDGSISLDETHLAEGELYYDESGSPVLPLGTYLIYESQAPEGYLIDSTVYLRLVEQQDDFTAIGSFASLTDGAAVAEQVKRGDIEFTKRDGVSAAALAGVPFRITSLTTGETHVVFTDENGYWSSSAAYNSHEYNTNGNDGAYDSVTSSTIQENYDSLAGTWFGTNGNGTVSDADDSLCALPYDTYLIEELACTANDGLELVTTAVTITRDSYTIDLGTLDDAEPNIRTSAWDGSDGDKTLACVQDCSVVDRVTYANLTAGLTYTLDTQLLDTGSGTVLAETGTEFTADASAGYIDAVVSVDASQLAGTSIVVYETLGRDGRTIAYHCDSEDTEQTVTVSSPSIATSATDASDGDKTLAAGEDCEIVDAVSYSGLTAGVSYILEGSLMVKSTGEILVDADGQDVTASVEFIPEESSGTETVSFAFDSSVLDEGTELVVFETLTSDGETVAEHANLDDEGQTVAMAVSESASDASGDYGQTGASAVPVAAAAAFLLFSAVAAGAGAWKLRMRANGKDAIERPRFE